MSDSTSITGERFIWFLKYNVVVPDCVTSSGEFYDNCGFYIRLPSYILFRLLEFVLYNDLETNINFVILKFIRNYHSVSLKGVYSSLFYCSS